MFIGNAVTRAITEVGRTQQPEKLKSQTCVEAYGVTLNNGSDKEPEPNNSRNGPAFLHGTMHNTCSETLKNVVLQFVVRDDRGTPEAGGYDIDELRPAMTQTFEFGRAGLGKVTSWEITANK